MELFIYFFLFFQRHFHSFFFKPLLSMLLRVLTGKRIKPFLRGGRLAWFQTSYFIFKQSDTANVRYKHCYSVSNYCYIQPYGSDHL